VRKLPIERELADFILPQIEKAGDGYRLFGAYLEVCREAVEKFFRRAQHAALLHA